MKIVHLSDLHLGKRVNEFSMLEDQAYILIRILNVLDDVKPDAVIIAGDVYDKSVPSAEAVEVFDDFLWKLAQRRLQVFIISGNHDSAERIAFASRLIDSSGIHLSPVYNGNVAPVSLQDQYGPVNFYMLPFIKPAHVRRFFEDAEINSYTDALRVAIDAMEMNHDQRNVLITHQFVTGASRSESEDISVGGTDNIDAEIFADFDYVALGHIHRPQNCGSKKIRYCGTPLKYSFSEANDQKSVTVGELSENGELTIRTVPLTPLHDMVEIRGAYDELTAKSYYDGASLQEDYVHITLTDEEDIPDAVGKLRTIYHNLMKLDYDNQRTRANGELLPEAQVETKSPLELFGDFYRTQNGQELTEEQQTYLQNIIESGWED